MTKHERRTITCEVRSADEGKSPVIVGHAAVFNSPTDIGGWFTEQIAPGAFTDSIAADDIRALKNHDSNYVLGRNRAGTLRLSEDAKGLAVEIDPPDAQWVTDLLVSMQRGDITQMSFCFSPLQELWDDEARLRTLLKMQLYEVSVVTFPAYTDTDASVRSAEEILREAQAKRSGPPASIVNAKRYLDLLQIM